MLGSGVDARAPPTGSSGTRRCRDAGRAARRAVRIDRASENDALNSYPDEWFESVQAYVDAIKRRGWLGVSDMRAKWSAAPRARPAARRERALRGGRGRARRPARRSCRLGLAATANIAATLSCKPVLQTFWSQTDEGAWFEKQEWSLRGVAPYHIRANVARAAHELDDCPRTWSRSSTARACSRCCPRTASASPTAPATRAARRAASSSSTRSPRARRRRGRPRSARAASSRDLLRGGVHAAGRARRDARRAQGVPALAQRRDVPADERRARRHGRARARRARAAPRRVRGRGARAAEERARLAWDALQELSDESDDDLGAANVRPPPPLLSRLSSSLRRTQSEDASGYWARSR